MADLPPVKETGFPATSLEEQEKPGYASSGTAALETPGSSETPASAPLETVSGEQEQTDFSTFEGKLLEIPQEPQEISFPVSSAGASGEAVSPEPEAPLEITFAESEKTEPREDIQFPAPAESPDLELFREAQRVMQEAEEALPDDSLTAETPEKGTPDDEIGEPFLTVSAAELYFRQGQTREALHIYQKLYEKSPEPDILIKINDMKKMVQQDKMMRKSEKLLLFLKIAQKKGKDAVL
jgi:hypothetical protein